MGPDTAAEAAAAQLPGSEEIEAERLVAAPVPRAGLGRAAATITFWNLISRITGFGRVIAVAGALGIATLGDSYQRANEVSNVLFELLAGGLLFSVLVPSFVDLLRGEDRAAARALSGALVGRSIAVLGVLAVAGMVASHWVMRGLTTGVPAATRQQQVELGAFLLLFVLPQLLLYAAGSVASALLQADHRFVATSVAPVFNNLVVIGTMIAFARLHDPARGFALSTGEKVLLGTGTLGGTVAMTAVPFVAAWRSGLGFKLRWRAPGVDLRHIARRGLWGAGHIGLNEVLVGVTIVLSGKVAGGVIAYQTAFTFFLLPHALLGHPIFTALFPRLAKRAAVADQAGFAEDLSLGVRSMLLLLLPAAGLAGAVAAPALSLVRIGELDAHGVRLVAAVLAAYLAGLAGYSTFYLFTRASYAVGNVRRPTLVNLGVTASAVGGMLLAANWLDGTALLVAFGLVQATSVSLGSLVLYRMIRAELGCAVPVGDTAARALVAAAAATAAALLVALRVGWRHRVVAVGSVGAASAVGLVVYGAVLALARTPELEPVRRRAIGLARRLR